MTLPEAEQKIFDLEARLSAMQSDLEALRGDAIAQINQIRDQLIQQDDFEEEIISGGGDDLPDAPYIPIGNTHITIIGTKARYIWVDVEASTAEYKTTTVQPFPPGIQIIDTAYREFHFPRLG